METKDSISVDLLIAKLLELRENRRQSGGDEFLENQEKLRLEGGIRTLEEILQQNGIRTVLFME